MAFDPTRSTPVSWGRTEGMNFGNMAVEPVTGWGGDHDGGGGKGGNIEFWYCGGDHMKRYCPLCAKEK